MDWNGVASTDVFKRDAHIHLQEYSHQQLDLAIKRAMARGIERFDCCGTMPSDWNRVSNLAMQYKDMVFPYFGIHPWYISEHDVDVEDVFEFLVSMLQKIPFAGVGEIGLDYKAGNFDYQKFIFSQQLELAKEYGRPVAVHTVGMVNELYEHLVQYKGCFPELLIHSPSMSYEMAEKFLKLGAIFSFNIFVLNEEYVRMRELAARIPPESLRFETDSPRRIFSGYEVPELNGLIGPELLPEVHKEVLAIRRRYAARGVLS